MVKMISHKSSRSLVILMFTTTALILISGCGAKNVDQSAPKGTSNQAARTGIDTQNVKATVEKILSSRGVPGYQPIPQGVRLLSVETKDDQIVLNFSKELLSQGTEAGLEDALHQIFQAIGNAHPELKDVKYTVLIEGKPLESYRGE